MLRTRREILHVAAIGAATPLTLFGDDKKSANDLRWYNVRAWGVEGRAWSDTHRYFDRLPKKAQQTVRPAVWNLSRHSAGMSVAFATNAPAIDVRYGLFLKRLAMPHMPATGVSGVDLYAHDSQGRERWLAVSRPTRQKVNVRLARGIDTASETRQYRLYLPLYNGVESLEIGLPRDATFAPIAPRKEKPIVFYGTSIMHGACASRPGMSITGILGRRLNRPIINLGFSGNGRMEEAVGALLAELNASAFVIDCLPNMLGAEVKKRAVPLVRQLRRARPEVPIVLVEDRTYTNAAFLASSRKRHAVSRKALRMAYQQLQDAGIEKLHYLAGDKILGDDGDAATDGSHPSDLGMVRYANAYEPVLRQALAG